MPINERTEFENHYYKLVSEAHEIIGSYDINPDLSDNILTSPTKQKVVKLPTISLPKFNGSPETWLEFHDTFVSLIHKDDKIDEVNKFHYLKSCLEGSATEVIKSIKLTASNYSTAWNILCERFESKHMLIKNHIASLINIDRPTKESSVTLKLMVDDVNKNLRALKSLGEPVEYWDTLLIHIISQKLHTHTFTEWEKHKGQLGKNNPIKLVHFMEFLRDHAELLETVELSKSNAVGGKNTPKIKTMVSVPTITKNNSNTLPMKPCPNCKDQHYLNNCPKFLALSNEMRYKLLPKLKICFNCFRGGHFANSCKKPGCQICKRRHNTLVHVNDPEKTQVSRELVSVDSNNISESTQLTTSATGSEGSTIALTGSLMAPCATSSQDYGEVLLSTALVKLYDSNNCQIIARAILDSGSTSCLMTESLFKQLNLPADCTDKSIVGINNITSHIRQMCRVSIKSLNESFSACLSCFILPSITDNVPGCQMDVRDFKIPSHICLADPHFYAPAAVDLIIGADIFWDILGSQSIKLGVGRPTLHETRLGWIVSGPLNSGRVSAFLHQIKCNFAHSDSVISHDNDIQNQLMRFWQLEEACPQNQYFPEEKLCEEHFIKHTTRLTDGRFCVRIPLKNTPSVLGDSYQRAKHCLFSLERRFKCNHPFSELYKQFMSEYEQLGHMSECKPVIEMPHYFIPHHGILRESSATTKLRVVFNASSPTSSGISFNNIQMIGPIVQDDLLSIILRFRQHKYVLVADVEKMYRQIVVHESDMTLQLIVWRKTESDPIKLFQLNRVSYGTASAPYLATRCLKEIGLNCADSKISEIIIHDFYVDDLLTGGDDFSDVLHSREQITAELASACMPLRKWRSNEPKLLLESNQSCQEFNFGNTEPSKTLGLGWHSASDEFYIPIGHSLVKGNTKRDILSVIAQIFDPLGLLSPCVILLKILLQRLWLQGLSWNDELPSDISQVWIKVVTDLPTLNSLRIPRHVICDSYTRLELHIFSDASERAYGACIYVLSVDSNQRSKVNLLFAKSRVAPIKPMTIPRLELSSALIGVRIYKKCIAALRVQISRVIFWTDSTIVLGWLKTVPSKLQPFVRNRVAEILDTAGNCTWRHVPTNDNPADLISRGVSATILQSHKLWWQGPEYLKHDETHWPPLPGTVDKLPEIRKEVSLHTGDSPNYLIDFSRFSNFSRLQRTVAYVLHFINLLKRTTKTCNNQLDVNVLQKALVLILRISQIQSFPEYNLLLNNKELPRKSPLIKFNVYLDPDKLIRVGGRLDNSSYAFEKKHPIILQSTHHITRLIFLFEHKRLMHAGPQLLLATIRETYWPIGGRNLARKCYRQCIRCTRIKGRTFTPLMGNLPQQRLDSGSYPFKDVGVDYAGPVVCASRAGRGGKLIKSYIAIFICFATKAVHLELVSDLTSQNYLLALRRFISRRGKPSNIFSDNGTSFVGAYHELQKFLKNNCDSLVSETAQDNIKFHLIPAYSPNFGGLWEAGVKSTKYHLNRVLGNCHLTFEELTTVLVQIEAILNSRPLTPLSADPDDLTPLTPGHFLIGRPFTSLPVQDYQDRPVNRLTRYNRIEQLRQHFWTRWSKEYITELQQRVKWNVDKFSLKPGMLVLLKEDNVPPMHWRLGRIVSTYPGSIDAISRVADIKTASGVLRRSAGKIVPLLLEQDVAG